MQQPTHPPWSVGHNQAHSLWVEEHSVAVPSTAALGGHHSVVGCSIHIVGQNLFTEGSAWYLHALPQTHGSTPAALQLCLHKHTSKCPATSLTSCKTIPATHLRNITKIDHKGVRDGGHCTPLVSHLRPRGAHGRTCMHYSAQARCLIHRYSLWQQAYLLVASASDGYATSRLPTRACLDLQSRHLRVLQQDGEEARVCRKCGNGAGLFGKDRTCKACAYQAAAVQQAAAAHIMPSHTSPTHRCARSAPALSLVGPQVGSS